MEWRPQKEGIATRPLDNNLGTRAIRWNGDLKKKGLRRIHSANFASKRMEWRPQKEGIATLLERLPMLKGHSMEWRPQKEGIATHPFRKFRIKKDGMETSKRRDCDPSSPTQTQYPGFEMEWRPQKEGIATRKEGAVLE